MRKAIMIIAAMLTLFGGRAMAQRCLPGMSAVEIKADMADGFYTGNSRNCGYSLGVFYSVYKGGANTCSFGGVSALGGYETVNWGKSVLSDGSTLHDGDNFIYGGALTLQADFYLSDKIALTANIKERFTFGSDVQIFHTQYGIGVKFIIE